MTLSGMTPAAGWRLLEVGERLQAGDEARVGQGWMDITDESVGMVIADVGIIFRRRLDPSLDPLTPLREEMRAVHELLAEIISEPDMYLSRTEIKLAKEWLTRNAAFGPGKGAR
jgi:hypothetical protein